MIWNSELEPYKGIRTFVQQLQSAQQQAHNAIITALVKQMTNANRKCRPAPFTEGDLVYLLTQNISLPKGKSRKLSPKFIGPYKIIKEIVPNVTYQIDLPADLKRRGVHHTFHASLLRIHIPNDDRRFPGRDIHQLPGFGGTPNEWTVNKIVSHTGAGTNTSFLVLWNAGDSSWLPYCNIQHLQLLKHYFDAIGCKSISELRTPPTAHANPPDDETLQVSIMCIEPKPISTSHIHSYSNQQQLTLNSKRQTNIFHSLTHLFKSRQ
jgi:hypothetical protein